MTYVDIQYTYVSLFLIAVIIVISFLLLLNIIHRIIGILKYKEVIFAELISLFLSLLIMVLAIFSLAVYGYANPSTLLSMLLLLLSVLLILHLQQRLVTHYETAGELDDIIRELERKRRK